jgi:hypothetical protein
LDENSARSVLLIRAIEVSDPACEVLTQSDRHWASREAGKLQLSGEKRGPLSSEEETFLVRRAERARERLAKRFPALARVEFFRSGWVTPLIVGGAFLLGIATNVLGGSHRINIIAFPLLGMLAWNALVYLFLISEQVRSQRRERPLQSHPLRRVVAALMLPSSRFALHNAPVALAAGVKRFYENWLSLASPIYSARAKRILHLAAALLAAGAVTGMYIRGLGFEYLAGWESTFLSERNLHPLLKIVLGPASAVTGIVLPDEQQLAELRWSATQPGKNAAPWIHLYAVTAALIIVIPRLLLALAAWIRERKLASNVRLPDDPYFRRLLYPGNRASVRIVPYSYQPSNAVQEKLRRLLVDLLGEGTRVEFDSVVPYGAEESYLSEIAAPNTSRSDHLVVLFNLATTPEEENHEFFMRGLQHLIERGRTARQLIALIDESSYRSRLAGESAARIDERRRAWRELLLPYTHAFVDLANADDKLVALRQLFANAALEAPM